MPTDKETLLTEAAPLAELAKAITACGKRGMTPVIVCSDRLTLEDEFYVSLCQCVHTISGCFVRFDALPQHRMSGWLGVISRRHGLERLRKRLAGVGTVSPTIALSRTIRPSSEIVIGLAGAKDHLPSYAKSIELAA